MMTTVEVTVDWRFEPDEPDGSQCYCCKDSCYLSMWLLVVRANGKLCEMEPQIVLCGACHDAMESAK